LTACTSASNLCCSWSDGMMAMIKRGLYVGSDDQVELFKWDVVDDADEVGGRQRMMWSG
jgi:hypothetical protein